MLSLIIRQLWFSCDKNSLKIAKNSCFLLVFYGFGGVGLQCGLRIHRTQMTQRTQINAKEYNGI